MGGFIALLVVAGAAGIGLWSNREWLQDRFVPRPNMVTKPELTTAPASAPAGRSGGSLRWKPTRIGN
ncbi:hypothetical protein ES703_46065 [subsurface metagenome]